MAFSEALQTCSRCGKQTVTRVYTNVNVGDNPELRELALSGSLFLWECPECGAKNLISSPLLYSDPDQKFIVCFSQSPISAEGDIPGYVARQVPTVGAFIEKVKILSSGLDDIAMELCKMVTCQELGKQVDLKFLSIDGADQTITLTYPENGEMQMLEVGFNVYEDCRGIVSRNPVISESAKGLATVDQAFLSRFIG